MKNHSEQNIPNNSHPVFGGRAYVFKRNGSRYWYAAAFLEGRNYRESTKKEKLEDAIHAAEEWYIALRGQAATEGLKAPEEQEPTFAEVAAQFMREYSILTEGQRSPRWVVMHEAILRVHLLPFFGDMPISEITTPRVQEYRIHRMTPRTEKNPHARDSRPFKAKLPAPKTLHNEIVTLRLVLKSVLRKELINALPDLSAPFRKNTKVSHRAWFSPAEYKTLYTATREKAKTARPQDKWNAELLLDFVLFMANTGLRPDEAANLQHGDVEIVHDQSTDETILVIEVRGKRGVGYCKSTPMAVKPYQRLYERPHPKTGKTPLPSDHVFPGNHIKMFNALLKAKKLKTDRDNQSRTAYSLRHTYICLRLMEGADIYQIAKNCRTSVEMIEKHYAAHIKHLLDAGLINTRKPKGKSTPAISEEEL
ncbi:MAG: site-specific integrase [Alphaproteobacteria bacterium]|nr:site-specific integrase [Alphaproteobacteria bacterium]